jgi:hypothetical protein
MKALLGRFPSQGNGGVSGPATEETFKVVPDEEED